MASGELYWFQLKSLTKTLSGTPNSGTTSLSALSTVAIKDGHQGHSVPHGHHHNPSTGSNTSATTLDAERADRISRLAGLERVSTLRGQQQSPSVSFSHPPGGYGEGHNPLIKERSTVGSASATGSVGGRTTWADNSDAYDHDKMSEDQDDISSTGGFSDEGNASLVGFGEGANSTISGPISTAAARAHAARQNSLGSVSRGGPVPQYLQHQSGAGSPMSGVASTPTPPGSSDPRMMDGVSYDANVIDTTTQGPIATGQHGRNMSSGGTDMAERILRDRIGSDDGSRALESPDGRNPTLGKFPFEKK